MPEFMFLESSPFNLVLWNTIPAVFYHCDEGEMNAQMHAEG